MSWFDEVPTIHTFVSLIVPCREERHFIGDCLDSILANDYPRDRYEILVVDGMSRDGSSQIVEAYTACYRNIRLLSNERGTIPAAMNIGVLAAKGEVVMKIDAHCRYPSHYIAHCVAALQSTGADNVGGVLLTLARDDSIRAQAIALVLAHPFGSGNSHFRIGGDRPLWTDTVAFGCYRRQIFDRIGYFDESLRRSSDMDFNVRLRRAGGSILLVPDIKTYYYPSSVRLWSFCRRNMLDGFWVLYPTKRGAHVSRPRHLVPAVSIVVGLGSFFIARHGWSISQASTALFWLYLAVTLGVSTHVAWRQRSVALLCLLPPAFMIRHIAYGVGSLVGLVAALASPAFWSGGFRGGHRTLNST